MLTKLVFFNQKVSDKILTSPPSNLYVLIFFMYLEVNPIKSGSEMRLDRGFGFQCLLCSPRKRTSCAEPFDPPELMFTKEKVSMRD